MNYQIIVDYRFIDFLHESRPKLAKNILNNER